MNDTTNERPSREQIQESAIFRAAYAAALDILSESSEFTQPQRETLAQAMAHAAIQLAMDWQIQISNRALSGMLYDLFHPRSSEKTD